MIRGEHTNLRAVERTDAPALFSLLNDAQVLLGWGMPGLIRSRARVEAEIEGWLEEERQRFRPPALVIETLDGAFAGLVLIRAELPHGHTAELSIAIAPGHWHQGLATDALSTILDALFDDWGTHRVQLRCEAGNERAIALYERLGFRLEGTLRGATYLGGRFSDQLVFGLLSTDERGW